MKKIIANRKLLFKLLFTGAFVFAMAFGISFNLSSDYGPQKDGMINLVSLAGQVAQAQGEGPGGGDCYYSSSGGCCGTGGSTTCLSICDC